MSAEEQEYEFGVYLKRLLSDRSLSMRRLSELSVIDTATISRIINGKRKANPEHLQKLSASLGVPINDLYVAAGFPIEQPQIKQQSDLHMSVDCIENVLQSANLYDDHFSIANVEQQLANYQQYAITAEGKENIQTSFGDKLKKIGSIGPFINHLKEMYEKFSNKNGTTSELAFMGSALIYFIISVDVIPDYIFPVGYIDDAIAVHIITNLLSKK